MATNDDYQHAKKSTNKFSVLSYSMNLILKRDVNNFIFFFWQLISS